MRTSRIAAFASCLAPALGCWAAGTATLPRLDRIYVSPEPVPIVDFTLTDQDGKARAFSSLQGEPVLVFFGFTHCPSTCPTTLARLRMLHEARDGALKSARIVLISVDGDRDTPERLKAYLAPLSAGFIGLTGEPRAIAKIAAGFAAVFFREPAAKDGGYNVMHSTQVFAVDKAGRLRATFADASIDDMATVTGLLLDEPG
jgi:protein SCO1/2